MSQGIKISKEGYDVKTCTPDQLSMSSEYKSFKIHDEGEWSQAVVANNSYTVTIPHTLGYSPCYMAFGMLNPGVNRYYNYPASDGIAYVEAIIRSDTSNLYIALLAESLTTSGTIYGYYYIFKDKS